MGDAIISMPQHSGLSARPGVLQIKLVQRALAKSEQKRAEVEAREATLAAITSEARSDTVGTLSAQSQDGPPESVLGLAWGCLRCPGLYTLELLAWATFRVPHGWRRLDSAGQCACCVCCRPEDRQRAEELSKLLMEREEQLVQQEKERAKQKEKSKSDKKKTQKMRKQLQELRETLAALRDPASLEFKASLERGKQLSTAALRSRFEDEAGYHMCIYVCAMAIHIM